MEDTVSNLPSTNSPSSFFQVEPWLTPSPVSEEDPRDSEPIGTWQSLGGGYRFKDGQVGLIIMKAKTGVLLGEEVLLALLLGGNKEVYSLDCHWKPCCEHEGHKH